LGTCRAISNRALAVERLSGRVTSYIGLSDSPSDLAQALPISQAVPDITVRVREGRRTDNIQSTTESMSLQITGKIIEILEEQSGTGKNGEWRKQEFILEIAGQYPKPVCVVQWGDNIDKFGVTEGETLTAHIDIQSREYNGRWYTDVKAWKIERSESGQTAPQAAGDEPWPEPPSDADDDGDDSLPF